MVLLEEACYKGWTLRFQKPHHFQLVLLLSAECTGCGHIQQVTTSIQQVQLPDE